MAIAQLQGEQNPFLRYREQLDSYQAVIKGQLGDEQFVEIVGSANERVREISGTSFTVSTALTVEADMAEVDFERRLVAKCETANVGGSHKARHIFGVGLHLLVEEALGAPRSDDLAIASCGNAAIAAAIVARALKRRVQVFVPTWADSETLALLDDLGAEIQTCERVESEPGDPCYLRFRQAVEQGATPFSVQGVDTPTTFDGGRTIAWELLEQAPDIDAIYVQVGGGALGAAVGAVLSEVPRHVRLYPVQAQGCAPLALAWERLAPEFDFAGAEQKPDDYMVPWDSPFSLASGIIDDITYDWVPLLSETHASGGHPIVVPEHILAAVHAGAMSICTPPASATGTAGLAGLVVATEEHARPAVLITGVQRA